ncbi:MAG: DUF4338 domain-containing protein [Acidobacteria bacterium]|nr:DUF4338 domain-containing protein [Acidobacteriota bacterium]MBI3658774.1 DUF4338 domain-containing protein [Acidobacteriota bacterium]
MTMPLSLTFCGRTFALEELEMIAEVVLQCAGLSVTEISRTVCELLEWKRPTGRLKNHECRLMLERLEQQGHLRLPPVRALGGRGPRRVTRSKASDVQPEIVGSAGAFEPLRLEVVEPGPTGTSQLWRELIDRYHYLGYRVPVGATLRYLVRSGPCSDQVLACMLWSSPAWKMAARDRWIGWTPEQRARNLPWIVNNSRFLILPWVRVKGLASKILSHCARRLPDDWETRYGYRPLLLETLVDAARFSGTCYRASNWLHLGVTTGRGRMDRAHAAHGRSPKQVYVYPLTRKVPACLCAPLTATSPALYAQDIE